MSVCYCPGLFLSLVIFAAKYSVEFLHFLELRDYNASIGSSIIFNKNTCSRSFQEHMNVQEGQVCACFYAIAVF